LSSANNINKIIKERSVEGEILKEDCKLEGAGAGKSRRYLGQENNSIGAQMLSA
jgi:hypothetical protein